MRTEKSVKNFTISAILSTIVALIGIVKSKMFLTYLGNDLTGIYQLFNQLFSYISLVDSGLTGSLLFSLYKPVSSNNYKQINAILKAGKKFFNIIAFVIIILGILLSLKIDFFISDTNISMLYIQICFVLFIIACAINYFVTCHKLIIEANQNVYIIHIIVYSCTILKAILEIIFIWIGYSLLPLMILFMITSLLQNVIIYFVSKKMYPYLNYSGKEDRSFLKETKNLFIQKVGLIIFNNIDIVLISKFISVGNVVIYTCYTYITNSLLTIFKKISSSTLAGIGNLLVTEKNKSKNVFYEYNSICFFIANAICIPLLLVITPFVELFYGKEYSLPFLGTLCVVLILYLKIVEMVLDVFITALGMFSKIKKVVIVQSIINLVLSISVISRFGISGVLLATVVSYLLGEFTLYPKIIKAEFFKKEKLSYYSQSGKLLIGGVIGFIITKFCMSFFTVNSLYIWFMYGVGAFIINFIINIIYFKIIKELRFIERFKELLQRKGKKR